MSQFLAGPALLPLAVWLYLVLLRSGFWRADVRLGRDGETDGVWPAVTALVPARNEATVIAEAVASLLTQDYPGPFRVVVVDDDSSDGTAEAALAAGARLGAGERMTLVTAAPKGPGWAGKLWALDQGLAEVRRAGPVPHYFWLTDADIAHGPDTLRRLVAKAGRERRSLVSLMVRLSCQDFWERLLIPPFVFFFQKLYPFSWVADPKRATAAAAGGCVLVEAEALWAAGGFAAIKGALIDDCALAALIKRSTRGKGEGIWLGLADDSHSIRPYEGLGEIWDMVARSAYTQLRTSPLLLAGTLLGMAVTYLAPPLLLLLWPWHGSTLAALSGAVAWALMAAAYLPTLRLYGQPAWQALTLPLSAVFYTAMTFDSALRHWRGRGGLWKGRVAARPLEDGAAQG